MTSSYWNKPEVGLLNLYSLISLLEKFLLLQKYLLDFFMTFTFDRCQHSWTVVTSVRYRRDIQEITSIFDNLKNWENKQNGGNHLSDPTPDVL